MDQVVPQRRRAGIYVVCSPQPHVGSTLTARLLLDFFLSRTGAAIGFDTNHLNPALAAVFPRDVMVIDLGSTRGQIMLFDRLIIGDGIPKVVDLWHASYDRFFKQATDFGFFEELRKQNLACLILLQMDPKQRFASEALTLSSRFAGVEVILVENAFVNSRPVGRRTYSDRRSNTRSLFIPTMDPTFHRLLEEPELLVQRFARMQVPEDLHGVQAQLREVVLPIFHQFEIIEVALEVGLPGRALLPKRPPPSA